MALAATVVVVCRSVPAVPAPDAGAVAATSRVRAAEVTAILNRESWLGHTEDGHHRTDSRHTDVTKEPTPVDLSAKDFNQLLWGH